MSVGASISTHRMVCVDIRLGLDIYTGKHRMVAECRLSWQLGTECWGHALHVVTPGGTLDWQWGATNTLPTSFALFISTFRYRSNHIVKNCTCQCLFKPFGFSHQKCSVLKKIYHRHWFDTDIDFEGIMPLKRLCIPGSASCCVPWASCVYPNPCKHWM